ncbi:MAG: putative dioxygenase [Pedosphaera sp.]|nr:putative dioxygenase [Pedosphaera sp.]
MLVEKAPTETEQNHRFSVEEYHRMAEIGIIGPRARVELLDGQIKDMSPIGPFHSSVVSDLISAFSEAAKGRWRVLSQGPVLLDKNSEPQPDLVLLKPAAHRYRHSHPFPENVYLLIEVSDSTLTIDRKEKLPAYARAGIPEVWIVNLNEAAIEVYREPRFTGYGSKTILRAGDKAAPQAFPDAAVDVAELLKR